MSLGQENLKQTFPESTGPDADPDAYISDFDFLIANNIQPDDPRLAASNWRDIIKNPDINPAFPTEQVVFNAPAESASDETRGWDDDQTATGAYAIPRRTLLAHRIKPLRWWTARSIRLAEPAESWVDTTEFATLPAHLGSEIRYSDYPFRTRNFSGYSETRQGYGSYTDQVAESPGNPAGIYSEQITHRFSDVDIENAAASRAAGNEALKAAIAHEAAFGTDESYSLYREASKYLNAALTNRPTRTIRDEATGVITLETQEADWELRMEYGHCLKKLAQMSIVPPFTDPLSKHLDRREVYEEIAERNLKHAGELMVQSLQAKHDNEEGIPAEELVPATITAVNDLQELGANEAAEALLHEAAEALDGADKRRFERFIEEHASTEEHQVIDISERVAKVAILDVITDSHRILEAVA